MMTKKSNYRWVAFIILFLFMLLHQSDRLLIGSMTTAIMEDFSINRIKALKYDEIKARYKSFKRCMDFGDIATLA